MGGYKRLKSDKYPHKFKCQNRPSISSELNRSAFKKINRKREITEILTEAEKSLKSKRLSNGNPQVLIPETSKLLSENTHVSTSNTYMDISYPREKMNSPPTYDKNGNKNVFEIQKSFTSHLNLKTEETISRGIQVQTNHLVHHRSKSTDCKILEDCEICKFKPNLVNAYCSPIPALFAAIEQCENSSTDSESESSVSEESYKPDSSESTADSDDLDEITVRMNNLALEVTKYTIFKHPKEYVGISSECIWILELLEKHTRVKNRDILLTLMKLRTDDTYLRLGNQFGTSTSQACKVFHNCIRKITPKLQQLILQPDELKVQQNLPIPFRAHCSNVYMLADAFEIEIQKPSNPVHQALTWSEYKKCNTLKYLIACTPDGLVIFVSKGFGGRVSDLVLFEESGIMDILPEYAVIMADRGFKNIESILQKKHCSLIRPPSVSEATTPSKEEALETKRVASLRIHVERVIGRIRVYQMLRPHACLNLRYLNIIDDVIQIVCGLINLQSPIIKK